MGIYILQTCLKKWWLRIFPKFFSQEPHFGLLLPKHSYSCIFFRCILFLFLLHQLYLRPSGIRSQRLRTSALLKRYLLILGCTGSSLLCSGFLSCSQWGLLSSYSVRASHRGDFSSCRRQTLRHTGFLVIVAHGLSIVEHRLSCQAACGIFSDQRSNQWALHCKVDS